MFDIEGARKAGYSDAEIADHLAGQKFDTNAAREAGYSDSDIIAHLSKAPDHGKAASLGAGLGKGVGTVALGAQKLVGRGLNAISASGSQGEKAAQWLINDADQGRAKLAAENAPYAEANPITNAAGVLGGEVAATLPVGGALAAPISKVAPNLAAAVGSAGMRGGNMATRMVGGGITGGASSALVDENLTVPGAVIGAVAPGAIKLAGNAGSKLANVVKPPQSAEVAQAVNAARSAGYVIPPTQANPTLANRLAEGFAGKISTAQNASAKNAAVTSDLAAKSIGLPAGTKITPDVLTTVRQAAGAQYDAVATTGMVTPGAAYDRALDAIAAPFQRAQQGFPNAKPSPVLDLVESLRSPQFDAGSAVNMLKALRSQADDAFRTGSTDVGRASKAAAKALEDALEAHLGSVGRPADLAAFREARKTIAKTYTIEKALNRETGSVDANKLAAQLAKGKPLSGELEQAARFAARFPKANQTVERMGSLPQTSPLDWGLGSLTTAATGNPIALAGVMARPAMRGYALSDFAQNRLVQSPSFSLQNISPALVYRSAPLVGAPLADR